MAGTTRTGTERGPRTGPGTRQSAKPGAKPGAARRSRGERERRATLLLTTGGAEDVLARLLDGDPLDLRTRILRRTAERALVLPIDRLVERAAVHCARSARDYRGRPGVDRWVERRIEEVLVGAGAGDACATSDRAGLAHAARRFNTCARGERDVLWRLAFAGTSLDELAHERGVGLVAVARAARRALDALLGAAPIPVPTSGPPTTTPSAARDARTGATR